MVTERENKVALCLMKFLHSGLIPLDGDRLYGNIL